MDIENPNPSVGTLPRFKIAFSDCQNSQKNCYQLLILLN